MSRSWHNQPPVLHRLVRAQARLTPDRIAAVYKDHWITYGELVDRSGGWAHRLRGLGVGVGTLVGLCLERSVNLPVLVMAVLEAGGVCVPLEPSDPPPRIAAMIREARPSLVLTQRWLRPKLAAADIPIVVVDGEAPGAAAAPEAPVTGDDLAFILLTSGSTGVPKGVMVSHAAAAARMFRPEDDIPAEGRCMAIVKTPIGNGPFLGEIFAPMLHGCYFAIASPDGHRDIPYLIGLMIEHRVSHIAMTSAMLRAFLECPDSARCIDLEAIYCGGEAVTDDLRARCEERLVGARFVVTYGATEAGHSLSRECPAGDRLDGTRVGRAIPGARVHLLGIDLEPTPAGEVGEMYLGGPRLATGYLNRPAATAERFVPHPSPDVPGERLYRSGDLGRLMPDGELEFKGRVDQLVKIGGNRVELLEIETALSACPGVHRAVVLARPNGHGEAHLVAYIAPEREPGPTARELRTRLAERLPTFMVPQVFVSLDAMPMTPNGKVDRRALPERDNTRPDLETAFLPPPRSSIEDRLGRIWCKLLGLDRVGFHDEFFELGGNSLLAVRMFARIEEAFGERLPVSTLFRAPTVERLAAMLQGAVPSPESAELVTIRPGGEARPLFFLPSLGGDVLYCRTIAQHLDPDQPVYGSELPGADREARASTTLESIAARHVDVIRARQPRGPHRIAGYSFSGSLAYEIARQLVAHGHRVSLLAIIDTGPAWRRSRSRRNFAQAAADFLINLPYLVADDLMCIPPRVLLNQALRKARLLLPGGRRRYRSEAVPPGLAASFPMEDDVFLEPYKERIHSNLKALHDYSPGSYPGRVTLYRARRRPLFHPRRDDLGWSEKAAGGVDIRAVPGNHQTILKEPNVTVLARSLQADLDRSH